MSIDKDIMQIDKEIIKKIKEKDSDTIFEIIQNIFENKTFDYSEDLPTEESEALKEVINTIKKGIEDDNDLDLDDNFDFKSYITSREIRETDYPNSEVEEKMDKNKKIES